MQSVGFGNETLKQLTAIQIKMHNLGYTVVCVNRRF
jgi:hypothetical protein